MPMIKVPVAELLKSKLLEEGWYPVTCVKVWDPETSKAGGSVNYKFTFLIEGQNGKEMDHYVNSKALGMNTSLFAAMAGKTKKQVTDNPEEMNIDTDTWQGKKIDAHIVQGEYNGQPKNEIADFLPLGMGKTQAQKKAF